MATERELAQTEAVLRLLDAQERLKKDLGMLARGSAELSEAQEKAIRSSQTLYIIVLMYGLQRKYGAAFTTLEQDLVTFGRSVPLLLRAKQPSRMSTH